ncbi:MAG: DUF2842 domain-containing protein [Sphingomonas sp.]
MTPSWRKPFGMLMLLLLIAAWASLVVFASPLIERLPSLVQALVYLVAGIVWILPLKPMLRWMETGVWRTF